MSQIWQYNSSLDLLYTKSWTTIVTTQQNSLDRSSLLFSYYRGNNHQSK